jgi:hypothetical protein
MKFIILSVIATIAAAIGLATLSANAQAQTSHGPAGPFANQASLTQAWQAYSGHAMNYLYLNGQLIHYGFGFGPSATGQYVTCPDSLIHHDVCPSSAPPARAVCSCEHYGSQYDGVCEVVGIPSLAPYTSIIWTPTGSAFLTGVGADGTLAWYDVIHNYGGGGLAFTINYANGTSLSAQCALGTPSPL